MRPYRLTSVLISRFLLNLQAADKKSTGMVSSTGSRIESAVFQRVIGSLGGEIDFGGDSGFDDFEEAVEHCNTEDMEGGLVQSTDTSTMKEIGVDS